MKVAIEACKNPAMAFPSLCCVLTEHAFSLNGMSYLEKFYNILRGYVCCPLTLDDVNPHWSVDVVRYRAGVVALVHRARLSIFFWSI